jgi:hypothetical protein
MNANKRKSSTGAQDVRIAGNRQNSSRDLQRHLRPFALIGGWSALYELIAFFT